MTVFAALLFTFAALGSTWVMVASWMRHGRRALALHAKLKACPETVILTWKMVERVPVQALSPLRADRKVRPARYQQLRPALEWPGAARPPLGRAA